MDTLSGYTFVCNSCKWIGVSMHSYTLVCTVQLGISVVIFCSGASLTQACLEPKYLSRLVKYPYFRGRIACIYIKLGLVEMSILARCPSSGVSFLRGVLHIEEVPLYCYVIPTNCQLYKFLLLFHVHEICNGDIKIKLYS